jgi:hypothetical protein
MRKPDHRALLGMLLTHSVASNNFEDLAAASGRNRVILAQDVEHSCVLANHLPALADAVNHEFRQGDSAITLAGSAAAAESGQRTTRAAGS